MHYFGGLKRMIAQLVVFFVPELIHIIGSPVLLSADFLRKIFWETIRSREKTNDIIRGDFIDSLIQLKDGEQNFPFS